MINHKGQNILHLAVLHGKHEAINYVAGNRSLKSLIDQRDLDGKVPLQLVASVNGETRTTLSQDKKMDLKIVSKRFTALTAAEHFKETLVPAKVNRRRKVTCWRFACCK
ncbi:hypothetical protein Droror1_Dr00003105 [Drosera rotundifolia]